MNQQLQANIENENIKDPEYSDVLNKISAKSSNIKAQMKFKYLIYKLQRNFLP